MSDANLQKTTVFIEKEDVEGTYKAPTAATSAISVLSDGTNDLVIPAKEVLERSNLNASLDKDASRSGIKSVNGTIPCELKAGDSEGEPEYTVLLESALGDKEAATSAVTSETDTEAIHTLTYLAKASHTTSEFVVFEDSTGDEYGVRLDISGTDAAPVVDEWTSIDGANTAIANVSGATTDAEVATIVETAMGTIVGLSTDITVTRTNEEITLTQVADGATVAPVSYETDGTAGNVIVATTEPGRKATTTLINLDDTSDFAVGDIVAIKIAGLVQHVSPIASIITDTSITLLVAYSAALETCSVQKMVTYTTADEGHPSFSISKYSTGAGTSHIEELGKGCKVTTMAIENFSTGQQPTINFSYEGLEFERNVDDPTYTPSFDSSLPVIALCAKVYQGSTEILVDEFTLSLENTLGFKTTTSSCNGRTNALVTNRSITGTFLPYKADNAITQYTNWLDNTTFSIFGYAYNPGSSSEKTEIIAFYMPSCQLLEITQADKDGLLQESLSFAARKHATIDTLKIAFC